MPVMVSSYQISVMRHFNKVAYTRGVKYDCSCFLEILVFLNPLIYHTLITQMPFERIMLQNHTLLTYLCLIWRGVSVHTSPPIKGNGNLETENRVNRLTIGPKILAH